MIIFYFYHLGIMYGSNDKISTRVMAISPGRTKLRLNVTIPGHVANCPERPFVYFSDAIDIEIFEGLVLIEPKDVSSRSVLMAPYSSLKIITNMDGQSQISYKYVFF